MTEIFKTSIGWDVIDTCCREFAKDKIYKTIIAIGSGGLIPGTIIHKATPGSTLYNLGIRTREQEDSNILTPVYQNPPTYPPPQGQILVVDDIYDTGKTFEETRKVLQRIWGDEVCKRISYYAVFLNRKSFPDETLEPPCLYSLLVDENTWLNFPWE